MGHGSQTVNLFHIRDFRHRDLHALAELINRADRVDHTGFATSADDLAHDLVEPEAGRTKGVLLAESEGALIGYTLLHTASGGTARLMAVGAVDPDWRRRGVGTALMLRVEERAEELVDERPVLLDLPLHDSVGGARELAQSLGYQPVRQFLYMVCPDALSVPAAVFPAHIGLRDYVQGQDEEEFVAAYGEIFADHWGEEPYTLADERHRSHGPSFRPQNNLLAIDTKGAIVGFCLLDPQAGGADGAMPARIDDLGVRPAYRGQGIGRALLLASMKRLGEGGAGAVGLFVDAASPYPSVHLYESVGFVAQDHVTVFRKEIGAPSQVMR
jgi:mycothiol synthase